MKTRRRAPQLALAALTAVMLSSLACRPRPNQPPVTGGGAQTVKVRYGPYTVPNVNAPGRSPQAALLPLVGMQLENGMINQPVTNVQKPCQDCWITKMRAGLEYADGSQATISRGMWLHHMVAMATGAGKNDVTCAANPISLPHVSTMTSPANTERFFASGNERTIVDLTRAGDNGYRVNAADRFHLLIELMNLNPVDETVWLTVEYTFVPGSTPGIRPVKPVWLDVGNCWTSELPAQQGRYSLTSSWTSTVSGTLVEGMGHLHDGGTNLTYDRGGEVFCDSRASYGTSPDFIEPGGTDHDDGGGHGHGGAAHISEMTKCPTGSRIAVGDVLRVTGNYDDAVFPQIVHGGRLHPVMALGILYYVQ